MRLQQFLEMQGLLSKDKVFSYTPAIIMSMYNLKTLPNTEFY